MDTPLTRSVQRPKGPSVETLDLTEPAELAEALRAWQAYISLATWALDSALRNLRIANERGTGQDIADARFAVREAEKKAREVWEVLT